MKNRFHPICGLLLAMVALGFISGCNTTNYYRLKQTRNDVGWAMTRYQNQVSFGTIAPSFQSQVTTAYQAYKTAFDTAAQQAGSNFNAPTPNNVKQLAYQLLSILGSIPAAP